MKFIWIVALLAPAALATEQATEAKSADWISLLQERCPDMSPKCLDIAKDTHQTDTKQKPNIFKDLKGIGACNPEYKKCTTKLSTSLERRSADAAEGNVVTCLLQILPDHYRYMSHPADAKKPFPADQTCPLRDLHRVAHVVLAG